MLDFSVEILANKERG